MSAALPFEPICVKNKTILTAEALAVGKSLGKLRSHVDIEMLAELYLDFSSLHAAINHVLNTLWIESV